MTTDDPGPDRTTPAPPLFVIKGRATPEEVAALVAVLQAATTAEAGSAKGTARSEWSAHHRKLRTSFPAGPGGWRSSTLRSRST